LTALCASGLAWENTLGGFQSQFYFLTGFSLAAIHGMLAERGPCALRWWLGLTCAALAAVSMGSGFLCLAPVAVVAAWRVLAARRLAWPHLITIGVAAGGLIAGWLIRAPAPWHDEIHAHNTADFLRYIGQCLAWPRSPWPWLCVVMWLPWLVLVVQAMRRKNPPGDLRTEAILAGGLWVLLQVLALAYARGAGAGLPASRYGDVLAVGLICNLLAFSAWSPARGRRSLGVIAAIWMTLVLGITLESALPVWRQELPGIAARNREYEKNVRGYVLTGEPHFIETGEVPLPYRDWLRRLLDRPAIRVILPVSVRSPVKLTADRGQEHGFVPGGFSPATPALDERTPWGSYHATQSAMWRSLPVRGREFHLWKFDLAGQPGTTNVTLQLLTPEGVPLAPPIVPARDPNDSWHTAVVRFPSTPNGVIVAAKDDAPDKWLAFSDPIEVSALSDAARRFCKQAPVVFGGGLLLLLTATVILVHDHRGKRRATILK
jgi:hypothetical protein